MSGDAMETLQSERRLSKKEEKLTRTLRATRRYIRSLQSELASEGMRLKAEGKAEYPNHITGLDYEQRGTIKKIILERCAADADTAGVSHEQHIRYANQMVDREYVAFNAVTTASMAGSQSEDETIRYIVDHLMLSSSAMERYFSNLLRCSPVSGMTTLFTACELRRWKDDPNLSKDGRIPLFKEFCCDAGMSLESTVRLRQSILHRFRGGKNPARTLLLSLVDEAERLICESSEYACGICDPYMGVPGPVSYWAAYPNSGDVSSSEIKSAMGRLCFSRMLEIRPDLAPEKVNVKVPCCWIPTPVFFEEVFWLVRSLGKICDNLSDAFTNGKAQSPFPSARLTPAVSVFTRAEPTAAPKAQARIRFDIAASPTEEFQLRFDHEDSGRLGLDIGNCTLKQGIEYALKAHELAKEESIRRRMTMPNQNGAIMEQSKIVTALSPLHGGFDPNTRLAIIGAAISNLGFLGTVRDHEVVSHHRKEHAKQEYTREEFRDAVRFFEIGMIS